MGFTAARPPEKPAPRTTAVRGYTTNLLCIIWVGYDDYSDIHLSGAQQQPPFGPSS